MGLWRRAHVDEQARRRDTMRERVARAVEAARLAQAGVPSGLGSASADTVVARRMEAAERAMVTGPLEKARRRAARGLAPELVWATARVAREVGRRPEEVWAEALHDWLLSRERTVSAASGFSPMIEPRRQRCWREIETTLQALRAS